MARPPYHIARQEHVGDALDDLQRRGYLTWRWEYDNANSRAIYKITVTGEAVQTLDTKSAEGLVQHYYTQLGVRWIPVPHPGGERARQDALRKMTQPD